ncbi:MAG: FadR/GntR family transcriptional regulator [Pseudomonadota bacterium]
MKDVFQEVLIDKVSDKISDQLSILIKEGKLVLGDKLPSERELIKILGVGRSSLREALNRLEILGYVEIRKRKGIFVKSISSTLQLDPLKQMMQDNTEKTIQLYEVRSDIEQANAYHAALYRNDQNIEDLKQCLDDLDVKKKNARFTWKRDQTFHSTVARSSHNIFRIHVLMNILDFSKELIKPIIEKFGNTSENMCIIAQQHTDIAQAIIEQDADQAREKMKEHLAWTNNQFVEYFKQIRVKE